MSLIDEAISLINKDEFDRQGNSRKCYFVNISGIEYALLISKFYEHDLKSTLIRYKETANLSEKGMNTPVVVDFKIEDGLLYELQTKVKGKTFAYRDYEQAGGVDNYMQDISESLKILNQAPEEYLLKFLEDVKLYNSNGYSLDCHPDNYYLTPSGEISFIDLDIYDESQEKKIDYPNIINIMPNIFSFFTLDSKDLDYEKNVLAIQEFASKWYRVVYKFLLNNGYSHDESIKEMHFISGNYLYLDKDDSLNILSDLETKHEFGGKLWLKNY